MDPAFLARKRLALFSLLFVIGCTRAAPPTAAALASDDADVLFDTVAGPPTTHLFHFVNVGETRTALLAVTLNGDLESFTITEDHCSDGVLAPGGSCDVVVQLANDDAGGYVARLRVGDGATATSVDMSGRVSEAKLRIDVPAETKVVEGGGAAARVTVTNAGGARSGKLAVSVAKTAVNEDFCSMQTLAGGASCTFDVHYNAPFGSGNATFAGTVAADPGGSESLDVLFVTTTAATLQISSADLGQTDPFAEKALKVTVTNPGETSATGVQIDLGPSTGTPAFDNAAFIIDGGPSDGCAVATLPPHGTCSFVLRAQYSLPTPGGMYSATITASGTNVHSVSTTAKITTILEHASVTFAKSGTGDGQIALGSIGTYCAIGTPTCSSYPIIDGETEQAVATAAAGSTFTQWSAGPCSGSTNPTCSISGANHTPYTVAAVFTKQ
jgi:hypothetical protein